MHVHMSDMRRKYILSFRRTASGIFLMVVVDDAERVFVRAKEVDVPIVEAPRDVFDVSGGCLCGIDRAIQGVTRTYIRAPNGSADCAHWRRTRGSAIIDG